MIAFKNCKLQLHLIAQSPMIHFQGDEAGATIRGSELKPKLDRFLSKKYESLNKGSKKALDYKVQVITNEKGEMIDIKNTKKDSAYAGYKIVYAKLGRNTRFVMRNADVTILCMNRQLQKLIEESIFEFFAVTNFGFMQGKGFGSFMPKEYFEQYDEKKWKVEIGEWLADINEANACYCMDFSKSVKKSKTESGRITIKGCSPIFKEIKDFYGILKGGRNEKTDYARSYIYQYMHKKGVQNEKAWLKANKIVPVTGTHNKLQNYNSEDCKDARYVRALLAIGGTLSYQKDVVSKGRQNIYVNNKGKEIDRMSSVIFFKIIEGYVFICAKRIPQKIYGKKFEFVNKENKKNKGVISVPSKNELQKIGFTIDDLLEKYVQYYNGEKAGEDGTMLRPSLNSDKNQPSAVKAVKNNRYVMRVR